MEPSSSASRAVVETVRMEPSGRRGRGLSDELRSRVLDRLVADLSEQELCHHIRGCKGCKAGMGFSCLRPKAALSRQEALDVARRVREVVRKTVEQTWGDLCYKDRERIMGQTLGEYVEALVKEHAWERDAVSDASAASSSASLYVLPPLPNGGLPNVVKENAHEGMALPGQQGSLENAGMPLVQQQTVSQQESDAAPASLDDGDVETWITSLWA